MSETRERPVRRFDRYDVAEWVATIGTIACAVGFAVVAVMTGPDSLMWSAFCGFTSAISLLTLAHFKWGWPD
ncbi:hypothetical protein V6N00_12635 [Tersicoccus sp. MR15.9]|uniref:hypothetical protein n=1 Tax=Tersicoccus mangrovi TaxID=3121635 RepID=UPI002FE5934A